MNTSNPLVAFEESLGLASALLSIDKSHYNNLPKSDELKPVQALRGGAAILLVAAFEQFIRDVVEYHMTELVSVPADAYSLLPESIRVRHTYSTMENAMKGSPHGPKKQKFERLQDIEIACGRIVSRIVNPGAFVGLGSNPNATAVNDMLKNCDISDFLKNIKPRFESKWRKPIAETFVRDKLDEIVNRRHIIAHSGIGLDITRSQIKESIRFVWILAKLIDKELERKITQIKRRVPAV